jgi:hypothetical protein
MQLISGCQIVYSFEDHNGLVASYVFPSQQPLLVSCSLLLYLPTLSAVVSSSWSSMSLAVDLGTNFWMGLVAWALTQTPPHKNTLNSPRALVLH